MDKEVKMAILYINLNRYQNTEKTDKFMDEFCLNIHMAMQEPALADVNEKLYKIETLTLLDLVETLDGYQVGESVKRLEVEVEELKTTIENIVGKELLQELCEKIEAYAKEQQV